MASDNPPPRIAMVAEAPSLYASAPPQQDLVRIVLILKLKSLSNRFFLDLEKGARQAESENNIELVVKTATIENAIAHQIQLVSEIVKNRSADAIVIAPSDPIRLAPVLALAIKSGITVVNIDTQLDEDAVAAQGIAPIPFVGVDNAEAAYQAASHLAAELPRGAEVAILEGSPTAPSAKLRSAGAGQAFAEFVGLDSSEATYQASLQLALELPRGTEVATLEGNPTAHKAKLRSEGARRAFAERGLKLVAQERVWTLDEAFSTTSNLLHQYPKLRAIYCVSDLIAIGAINYLGERSQQQVRLAGFDASPEGRAALQKNQLVATVNQRGDEQGYIGVKTALAAIAGTPVPPVILVETQVLIRSTKP